MPEDTEEVKDSLEVKEQKETTVDKATDTETDKKLYEDINKDGRCTCEIKSRIAMAKAAFNKKKTLFTSKLDLNLRNKLVKCYIWSMALYGAETWMLWAADQKYLVSFKMWCWRRMEKISWTNHVRNEEVLHGVMSRGISYMK